MSTVSEKSKANLTQGAVVIYEDAHSRSDLVTTPAGGSFIVTIPSDVLFTTSPTEFRVYAVIRSFAGNGRGVCFASKGEIAARSRVSRKTVYRTIKNLKLLGYIKGIGYKSRSWGGKPVEHLKIVDSGIINKSAPKLRHDANGDKLPIGECVIGGSSMGKGDTQKAEMESKKESCSISVKSEVLLDGYMDEVVELNNKSGTPIKNKTAFKRSCQAQLRDELQDILKQLERVREADVLCRSESSSDWNNGAALSLSAAENLDRYDPERVRVVRRLQKKIDDTS